MKKTDLTKTKKTDFIGLLKAFFGSSDEQEQEDIINSEENTWKNTYSDIIAESNRSIDSLEKILEHNDRKMAKKRKKEISLDEKEPSKILDAKEQSRQSISIDEERDR